MVNSNDLLKIPLFHSANENELESLRNASIIKSFPKNKIIVNENEEPTHVYFIQSGTCRVQLSGKSGKETIIKDLHEGDCFGEIGAFSHSKRCASVVAACDANLLIIDSTAYVKYCNNNIVAAQITINHLSNSLSKITKDYQSLAMDDLTHRLIRTLFDVSTKHDDKLLVKLTHGELANRTSSTRESVSRVIARLRKAGFIYTREYEIELDKSLIEMHSQL